MGIKIGTETVGGFKIGNETVGGMKVGSEIIYTTGLNIPVDFTQVRVNSYRSFRDRIKNDRAFLYASPSYAHYSEYFTNNNNYYARLRKKLPRRTRFTLEFEIIRIFAGAGRWTGSVYLIAHNLAPPVPIATTSRPQDLSYTNITDLENFQLELMSNFQVKDGIKKETLRTNIQVDSGRYFGIIINNNISGNPAYTVSNCRFYIGDDAPTQ